MPLELGARSTVHDRFQAWERAGFFAAPWEAQLVGFDKSIRINRSRRLLARWEKGAENDLAFVRLARAQALFGAR